MKKTIGIVILLLITYSLAAQHKYQFAAIVLNVKTKEPVVFAHVYTKATMQGTITNELGKCKFTCETNKTDTLVVSHLSYYPKKLLVSDVETIDTLYLQPFENELNEVVVVPKETVLGWLRSIAANIKINYPNKKYQATGFYRETQYVHDSKKYTRLLEMAFLYQDKKTLSPLENINAGIISLRKSDEFGNLHPSMEYLRKKFPRSNNNFIRAFKRNPLRSYFEDNSIESKYKELYNFLFYKTDTFFFVTNSPLGKDYKTIHGIDNRKIEFAYNFTFNIKSFAVIEYSSSFSLKGKVYASYKIKFRQIKGRYYPYFIQDVHFNDFRLKNNGEKSYGFSENLILLNDFAIDRKSFERIKLRNKLSHFDDVHSAEAVYDPKFWENYNIILDVPLEKKIESDLEQTKTLEEQYRNNSKQIVKKKKQKNS